ncbi:MAG: hypothetical protein LBF74_14135, partial [Treponema sp.]|nr:hypothetical protein [Treponema sp.]
MDIDVSARAAADPSIRIPPAAARHHKNLDGLRTFIAEYERVLRFIAGRGIIRRAEGVRLVVVP